MENIFTIKRIGYGWFNFEEIPQTSYIKVYNLNCGTEQKAVRFAMKLLQNSGIHAFGIKIQ